MKSDDKYDRNDNKNDQNDQNNHKDDKSCGSYLNRCNKPHSEKHD